MPSRKIEDCHPVLQTAWSILKQRFEERFPGRKMVLTCTHRTPEEQLELYKLGREMKDGVWITTDATKQVTWTLRSKHTLKPAEAFDVALIGSSGKPFWNYNAVEWTSLGELTKDLPVVWGGNWKTKRDMPHIEIKRS